MIVVKPKNSVLGNAATSTQAYPLWERHLDRATKIIGLLVSTLTLYTLWRKL